VFTDDVLSLNLEKYGPAFEKHDIFPRGANIEFVQVINGNELMLRTWERNCGETLACGTGCCAATVAGYLTGRCCTETVVHQTGGDIEIKYDTEDDCLYMTGVSDFVFEGELDESLVNVTTDERVLNEA